MGIESGTDLHRIPFEQASALSPLFARFPELAKAGFFQNYVHLPQHSFEDLHPHSNCRTRVRVWTLTLLFRRTNQQPGLGFNQLRMCTDNGRGKGTAENPPIILGSGSRHPELFLPRDFARASAKIALFQCNGDMEWILPIRVGVLSMSKKAASRDERRETQLFSVGVMQRVN